jgi:hypothetical protein
MKRFRMDKSGQIPLLPGSEEGDARWSVHPGFIIAAVIVILIVAIVAFVHSR